MNTLASAELLSWNLDFRVIAILILLAAIYLRGWLRIRQLIRRTDDGQRLLFFLSGLFLIFLALDSPLDALDGLYLAAHMTQHLLLMMFAPALILLGHPMVPLLRGLPKAWVKEGVGPFLTWRPLRSFFATISAPPPALTIFAVSTVAWHLPVLYELALHSPAWHQVQHACFFWTGVLFWWPVIRPMPGKSKWPVWTGIPYLMFADFLNTALSALFVFSGKVLYPSYGAVEMNGWTLKQDQTLAGAIMWVPGEMIFLIPVVTIAMRLVWSPRPGMNETMLVQRRPASSINSRFWRLTTFRRPIQVALLCLAIMIVLDGLRGPQLAPMNLAGVLPWIHWRAISVLALLLVGNLFCFACPFTMARDLARKVLPASSRWPRVLRNKWIPFSLIGLYLWTYEAFSLWNSPAATAAIIIGYFAAAILIDGFFRGASFCKYVCPIGQFHFISSLVSPKEIRVKSQTVCSSCVTYDCIRGNQHARGCELYLFQPKKESNLDCTFCLDCVKACPHENVGLISIAPAKTLLSDPYRSGLGKLSRRNDLAAIALLITFGAFVNAAGMITPVMMWQHRLHALLGPSSMPVIVLAFVLLCAIAIPAALIGICGVATKSSLAWIRRFVFALVPIGFGMWLAHLLYHIATSWTAIFAPVERLLTGTAAWLPAASIPNWLTPLQLIVLDGGLLLTLYVLYRLNRQKTVTTGSALALTLPWAVLSCSLYAVGVWILFQPMQMRGMLH